MERLLKLLLLECGLREYSTMEYPTSADSILFALRTNGTVNAVAKLQEHQQYLENALEAIKPVANILTAFGAESPEHYKPEVVEEVSQHLGETYD